MKQWFPAGEHHCRNAHSRIKKQNSVTSATLFSLNLINLSYALLPWREDFNEDSTLLCALDRIFDEATVFKLRGESFRGKKLDAVSVQTGKVKAVELLADQQEE